MILLPRWETVWSQADTSNGLCCCAAYRWPDIYYRMHAAAAACSTCHELTRWKYVLKHVRACKLQNVIKTLNQYMQLARLCLCASSAVACAVFTNRMRTWNRKLMIHVNKPRLNRSTLHTSPVRYQRFFFFDVRRPEISSQIFRNEKNISWCHQHICN